MRKHKRDGFLHSDGVQRYPEPFKGWLLFKSCGFDTSEMSTTIVYI